MCVGEEGLAEQRLRIEAGAQHHVLRHQEAGVGVRIGVGEQLTLQVCVAARDVVRARDDEIGLIERLAVIQRHSQQPHAGAVGDIGIAAHPREIQLIVVDQRGDFAVAAALHEYGSAVQTLLEVPAPVVEKADLVLEDHGRRADTHRARRRFTRRPRGSAQPAPTQRPAACAAASPVRSSWRCLPATPSPSNDGPFESTACRPITQS